jgi:hypothetical protein
MLQMMPRSPSDPTIPAEPARVFLLSPASCTGRRARMLLRPEAEFELAVRLRGPQGAMLGEAFAFISGLYFRGKLAYATAFGRPPAGVAAAFVITPCEGLVPPDRVVSADQVRRFAEVDVSPDVPGYRDPLVRDARALAEKLDGAAEVVLLGSIASAKYVDILSLCLGTRLRFPEEFVGRGDMSRGGLMLRCAAERRELEYVPIAGATRRGPRPPKLVPSPGILKRLAGIKPS